jgi:hypothetical protein
MADNNSSEFFKYGRGYALYSQGKTDVGAMGPDANDSQRAQAAIERDALLISKAIGDGMTLAEYRIVHDAVESLHKQFVSRGITQATYQEKLWELPHRINRDRKSKKPAHYSPTRDAGGNPVAKPPGSAAMQAPTEAMEGLSPDLADMPAIDAKAFWEETVAMARRDSEASPASGGGKPSSPSGASSEPSPVAPNQPAGRNRGMLDQMQSGLDAVGIVEPTPFADGTNAAISAVRALADPKHAGEHLRNAGISLVSAIVPYAGDSAKLLKYGKGATASGGISGALAGLASTLTGGGAGGSGGQSGSGSMGLSGGGRGGGRGSGGNGLANLIGGVAGSFGNLAKAMGPVGVVVAGAAIGLKAFVGWMQRIDSTAKKVIEDNRRLGIYDGSLGVSYMQLDAQRTLRDIDRAGEISGPMGRLTRAQSMSEQAQEDLTIPYKKLKTDLDALFAEGLGLLIRGLDSIDIIGNTIEAIYDWLPIEAEKQEARAAKLEGEIWIAKMRERMHAKGIKGRGT